MSTETLTEKLAKLRALKAAAAPAPTPSTEVAVIPVEEEIQSFPATPLGDLQMKLQELRGMLLQDHPMIPGLLQTIHRVMLEQGDLVIQLSEAEIGVFFQGLKNHMKVALVPVKAKKESLRKANAQDLVGGAGDLMALAASLGVTL